MDPSSQESEAAPAFSLVAKGPMLTTNSEKLFNDVAQDDTNEEVSASSSISGSGIFSPSLGLAAPLKSSFSASRREDSGEEENMVEVEEEEEEGEEEGLELVQEELRFEVYFRPRNTRPLSSASSTSTVMTGDSQQSSSLDSQQSSSLDSQHGEDDDDEAAEPLTRRERKLEQKRKMRRHKRRLLVNDAKRKQEQLERIQAQLELKTLGKIRQQVSFWEEKGVLEQKVVAMLEVDDDSDETNNASNNDSFVKRQQDEPRLVPGSEEGPSTSMSMNKGEQAKKDMPLSLSHLQKQLYRGSSENSTAVESAFEEKDNRSAFMEPTSPSSSKVPKLEEPLMQARRKFSSSDTSQVQMSSSESGRETFMSDID
ncbi:hypothetical protein BG011_009515 [Mortierella polycephala]|uniref:Uncharacterized protein n=1 Tax=Mortierella polycephala TaxID=41804 RepID=A0A9P6PP28_9FUNG|nr:hypothetical protein BG011_009515 [Mortierella polycephala]